MHLKIRSVGVRYIDREAPGLSNFDKTGAFIIEPTAAVLSEPMETCPAPLFNIEELLNTSAFPHPVTHLALRETHNFMGDPRKDLAFGFLSRYVERTGDVR